MPVESDTSELVAEQRDAKVQEGIQLHREGDLDAAQRCYREVLQVDPCHASALNFMGMVYHQKGRSKKAERLICRAIAIDPTYLDAYNNVGAVLLERKKFAEASFFFGRVLLDQPESIQALTNLARTYRAMSLWEEAVKIEQRLVKLAPNNYDVNFSLAMLYREIGQPHLAVEPLRQAIKLRPDSRANAQLGMTLYGIGEYEQSREVFSNWLKINPDQPTAKHMLAALQERPDEIPERASSEYVSEVFDGFAASFDKVLERLDYRAPSLVEDVMQHLYPQPQPALKILDAGCGTGLCGPRLAPFATSIIGVDLSARMLDRAAQTKAYSALYKAELTEFLCTDQEHYDVIVSADTLVYFGALEAVLGAAHARLRGGGRLVFTVEQEDNVDLPGYVLRASGRYAHSLEYLRQVLGDSGFVDLQLDQQQLRVEGKAKIQGLLVVATKPE